jgi:hypothetical protein
MTATALPRTIRVAALALLSFSPFVIFDLAAAAWTHGSMSLGPQLLAPVAGVGLLRGRRWGWALALVTTWLAIAGIAAVLIGWIGGTPLRMTLASEVVAVAPAVRALFMAGLLAFCLWVHWTLTRPAALQLFWPVETSPWGPSTSLWLAGIAIGIAQVVGGIGAAWLADLPPGELQDVHQVLANGTFLALASAVGAPLMIGLVVLAIRLRNGPTVAAYLALRRVSWRTLVLASLTALVLTTVEHGVNVWLGRPVPAFVTDTYRSAANPLLLWLAIVVFAPISEEVVFRGFLLTGLLTSWRVGTAVLLTAAIFTSLHLGQYAASDLAFLLLFGLALGVGRVRTGSLLVPIVMHATMNLAALVGTAARFSR